MARPFPLPAPPQADATAHAAVVPETADSGWAELSGYVMEHGPVFLIRVAPDGRVIAVNDTGCRLTGYDRESLVGANFWSLAYPGELAAQVERLQQQFRRTQQVRDYPMTLATRDGTRRVIAWTSMNRRDAQGEVVEIIGAGIDITAGEDNAQALMRTESRLAEAQHVARIGSWELDILADRYWWSEQALVILGIDDREPVIGYPQFIALVHEDDRAAVDRAYTESMDGGETYDIVYRVHRPEGGIRYVQGRCQHDFDDDGRAVRSVGTVQDVTESILQREKMREMLEETLRLGEYTDHVVENSPAFIVAISPDGTTTAINEAGCRFMECTREEILGTDLWRAMYPGALYAQVHELFDRFERYGGVKDHEMTMRSFAGTERTLAWTSVNRTDEDGNVFEVIGIGVDLTELRRSQAQLAEAQDIAGLGSWELDLTSNALHWSDEALHVLGLDPDELGSTLESFLACIHPDDRAVIKSAYPNALRNASAFEITYRLIMPDGSLRHIHGRCRHTYGPDGAPLRSIGTVQDLTTTVEQRERLERALDETVRVKAYHEHVVEHSPAIIMATSPHGVTTAINDAGCRVLGYRREEILGRKLWPTLCPGDKFHQVEALFREYSRHGQVRDYEMVIETATGEERIWSWHSVNRVDEDGNLIEAVGMATDITELKRSQSELQYLAHHDQLTGLPNRLLLGARLEHALRQARRRGTAGALLFIDLDRFKNINDSLGHPVGDSLLRTAAERLKNCVRDEDTVARLSGDEFTLLVENIENTQTAITVAEKVLYAFREPFSMEGHDITVTPSIGVSIFPRDGDDIDSLLRNADSAMYEAKGQGRNAYAMYTQRMTDDAVERVELENDLRRALEQDELVVFYQPQVELESGRLSGAEALLRWNHPEKGLIPPDRFIPLAEESGLIIPIGEWVLREACRTARAWLDQGLAIGNIAVNVAGPQIRRSNLAAIAGSALADANLAPGYLELEVTEGFIMSEAEHAITQLDDLRKLGVRLSIDDFGTGYSSLSYLKRLPVNQLKIDRSFVRDIPEDADDMAITEAVIALANSLRLSVVAEGVETEAQRRFLIAGGCTHGQGYLFHPAVAARDFVSWALARSGNTG